MKKFSLSTLLLLTFCIMKAQPPITSGLKLHLDANLGVTNSGLPTFGWADQSGSGNNMSIFLAGGTNPTQGIVNGFQAITFNGNIVLRNPNPSLDFDTNATLFVVTSRYTDLNNPSVSIANNNTTTDEFLLEGNRAYHHTGNSGNWIGRPTSCLPSDSIILETGEFGRNPVDSDIILYLNGNKSTTPTNWNGTPTPYNLGVQKSIYIGGRTLTGGTIHKSFTGKIYEVLAYNRRLSRSEINQVNDYLLQKYSISIRTGCLSDTLCDETCFWRLNGNNISNNNNILGTLSNDPIKVVSNALERMRVSSSGNVGINTINPTGKLHVNVTGLPNNAGIRLQGLPFVQDTLVVVVDQLGNVHQRNLSTLGSGNTNLQCSTINNVPRVTALNTLGCGQITDLGTGNIGIANTTPHASLHLNNTLSNRRLILWETADNNQQFYGFGISSSTLRYQVDIGAAHAFFVANNATSSNEIMRINSNGVGIGTIAPAAQLHTTGTVRFAGLVQDNTQTRVLVANSTGDLRWRDASTFGSGNTTNTCNTLNFLPRLSGTNTYSCSRVQDVSAGGGVAVGWNTARIATDFNYVNPSATVNVYGSINGTGVPANGTIALDVNGMVRGIAFFATSDARLKRDVKPIKNALDLVSKMQGNSYFWKEKAMGDRVYDKSLQLGFLAQEIEKVLPLSVVTDESGYKSVNYLAIIPVLTEAIKELNTKVEKTQKENEDLRSQLTEICTNGCNGVKPNTNVGQDLGNKLFQNYPNPFSNDTRVDYIFNIGNNAKIEVRSLEGKIIKSVTLKEKGKGYITISSSEMNSGTYTYSYIVDNMIVDTKLMIIAEAGY